jgi:hypothetical protein
MLIPSASAAEPLWAMIAMNMTIVAKIVVSIPSAIPAIN